MNSIPRKEIPHSELALIRGGVKLVFDRLKASSGASSGDGEEHLVGAYYLVGYHPDGKDVADILRALKAGETNLVAS